MGQIIIYDSVFAAVDRGYEKGLTFVTLLEQYFDLGQLQIKCHGIIFAKPSKFTLDKELTKNRI